MHVQNDTPFPAVAWESADANKQWHLTSLVRVKYRFKPTQRAHEWHLRLTPDQGELFSGDVFYHDDIKQPVRYESDFITYKPNTDIIINATSRSPSGKAETHWNCGLDIFSPTGERLKHARLQVCGQQHWEKRRLGGWRKSAIQAVTEVPLRYDRAYGGSLANPKAAQEPERPSLAYDPHNPVGTGIKHKHMPHHPHPVAQISWADSEPHAPAQAAGFGFIHRAWQPRLSYAGTYDSHWLDTQHPYPPQDFNAQHHQAANPALIMQGYLAPKTQIHLHHLLGKHPEAHFHLPELHCLTELSRLTGDTQRHAMPIDTVLIDIDAEDPAQWAVYLSYRHYHPIQDTLDRVTLTYLPSELLAEQQKTGHPAHGK